ncbi:MFS transporter [Saccharomonospora piscinae]|uniref:MFS transporter n=1 Tax=Saccharomonospora piscinae TaxID=687388 RepID=UPI0023B8D8EE|nr:MFS transporter [Saccharomonospora piscinae]
MPAPAAPSRWALPVVLTGVGLVAMSISGTAIALPNIGRELDTSGPALNWVVAGYNLAFAAMTLVAGVAADRVGRRKIFVVAAIIFSAGFLCTALAPTILLVDVARIASGAGGAGIMAAGGALLASNYDGAARNRAFALMGTMAGVGIAVGPTLVGGLISLTGWRGSFLVFAVVGLCVILGAMRLGESRDRGGPTDWFGSILFVGVLSCLMFALLEAPTLGWTHTGVLVAVVAGVLGLVAFVFVQRRSSSPILAPELVGNRRFMGWCLATLTTSIGFLGVLVFLPTYLQAAAQLSPATAGVVMLLLTAPVLLTPITAVSLVNRGMSARLVIMVALGLVVTGNLGMLALGPRNTTALVAAPLLAIGIGMGASFGITDGQAMNLVPAHLVGTAAGFLNTLRGAAEALVIAAFSASLLGFLTARLGDSGRAAAVSSGDIGQDRTAEIEAYTASWHSTQIAVAVLCLALSIVIAVFLFARGTRTTATTQPDHDEQR